MKLPRWTPEDLAWAESHIGLPGWSYDRLAAKLGRTTEAVKKKLKRRRVAAPASRHCDQTLSVRQVMGLLGWGSARGNHRRVRGWIKRRLLKAHRRPYGGTRPYYAIYPADLVEFLRRHPGEYERHRMPERLPDGSRSVYRDHAPTADPLAGYVPLKQAARTLQVRPETLRRWHREGRLEAVHVTAYNVHPQDWFLTERELARVQARLLRMPNGWWTLPVEAAQEQTRRAA